MVSNLRLKELSCCLGEFKLSDYLTRIRERQAVAYIDGLKQSGGERLEELPYDGEHGSEVLINNFNDSFSRYVPADEFKSVTSVEEIRTLVSNSVI